MFDPYGIYTRSEKKTRNGQVIRKKPVQLRGSVSRDDYGTISDYAEALGYQLLPKALVPFPEEDLSFTNAVFLFQRTPPSMFTVDYKLWNLTTEIQDLPNMLIVPSLTYTLNSLKIEFIIEYISAGTDINFTTNQTFTYYTYNQYTGVSKTIRDTESRIVVYSGDDNNQYYFYKANADTDWVSNDVAYSQEPLVPGPVDYIVNEWTDNDALDVYQWIQTADPSQAAPAGFPDIRYFRLFKSAQSINLDFRVTVLVTTNWTHTLNAEFIGQ